MRKTSFDLHLRSRLLPRRSTSHSTPCKRRLMKPGTEVKLKADADRRRKSLYEASARGSSYVNPGGNDARSGLTNTEFGRTTSEFAWTEEDEESLRVLKLGGALAIFMLLAYLAYDQHLRGRDAPGIGLHWLLLGITLLFFSLVWTRAFKRNWKFWTLLFAFFLISMFIAISRFTR